jgi:hypothetical protein
MLLSFSDPVAGMVPSIVPFQYNPAEMTRVLRVQRSGNGSGLRVAAPPSESYTLRIELDALGAPDRPITGALGVGPMLATIESMLEPGRGGLAALIGAVAGATDGGGAAASVPVPSLPLVVLAWSLERIVPVRIDTVTIQETGFDALLHPVQASVELSLTVLRERDFDADMTMAKVMATAYQAVRAASATVGIAQGVELML